MQSIEAILSNLSNVRTGYTFREKIEGSLNGNITVLQPKNIVNSKTVSEAVIINEKEIGSIDNHKLKKGDILIANKGVRFSVYLYNGVPGNCIASSSFFVISPNQEEILPEYLVWYLEQEPAKNHLLSKVTGSIIPSINKSAVQQLVIPLPPMSIQKYIAQLLEFSTQELNRLQLLIERKKEFYQSHIWEKIIQE